MRARITAGAAIAVAVTLVIGAVVVSELQERTLRDNVDTALKLRADDLSGLLADGSLPSVLSVRASDEALVQVLDPAGRVVAASSNIQGAPPLAEGFVPSGRRELRTFDALPIEDDPFRLIAQRLETADGVYTIYVAESLDPVLESQAALNGILLVAVPLLVLLCRADVDCGRASALAGGGDPVGGGSDS